MFNIRKNLTRVKHVRHFHPGLVDNKTICIPLCPTDNKSQYYKHVWGNEVQEKQLATHNYQYATNDVNKFSTAIKEFYAANHPDTIHFVPTSHNTPICTAFRNLRNINPTPYLDWLNHNQHIVDQNGCFINTDDNCSHLLTVVNTGSTENERNVIECVLYGVMSNYGDSIYIANDYLCIDDDKVILANYPDKASNREIERCRVAAYALLNGNYPILLDNHVEHEGEANIKFLPAMLDASMTYPHVHGVQQMCLTYQASRSSRECIKNINTYLERFKLPTLYDIHLKPRKGKERALYQLDCVVNFFSNSFQTFSNIDDFYENYESNGTAVMMKNGLDEPSTDIMKRLFKHIITVDEQDDPLAANVLMNPHGIVGSNKLKNKGEFQLTRTLFFDHPSIGGGGAHKCCSNVMKIIKPLSIEEWLDFMNYYNIPFSPSFLKGVYDEYDRIGQFYYKYKKFNFE